MRVFAFWNFLFQAEKPVNVPGMFLNSCWLRTSGQRQIEQYKTWGWTFLFETCIRPSNDLGMTMQPQSGPVPLFWTTFNSLLTYNSVRRENKA